MSRTNKTFSSLATDNLLWKKKFEQHFPHVFEKLSTQEERNWYAEFRQTYEDAYRSLPVSLKKQFSLVKEGDSEL